MAKPEKFEFRVTSVEAMQVPLRSAALADKDLEEITRSIARWVTEKDVDVSMEGVNTLMIGDQRALPGDWVVWTDNKFLVYFDEEFHRVFKRPIVMTMNETHLRGYVYQHNAAAPGVVAAQLIQRDRDILRRSYLN